MDSTDLVSDQEANLGWGPDYVAVIADMVGSREIALEDRTHVQSRFDALVTLLNQTFASSLKSRFIVTLGDEFQGILLDPSCLPDLLWKLEDQFTDRPLRVGIGLGPLSTKIPAYAINVDGPALHQARMAIDQAKQDDRMGGVFSGFGTRQDLVLNGLARLLWAQRQRWAPATRRDLSLLRTPMTQTAAARTLGITKQSIRDSVDRAFWTEYLEGEQAFTTMLNSFKATVEER